MLKKVANVLLREEGRIESVIITGSDKPKVDQIVVQKWQNMINLIARLLRVPSALIMQITEESMRVFIKSQNTENPYQVSGCDSLGHGLYCETVIGANKALLVDNALKYKAWQDNPDIKLNMVSYYGLPIQWPDQEFFGTICILDDQTNSYSSDFCNLMKEFKLTIERDLELLCNHNQLKFYAERDALTSVYNRRKLETLLFTEFSRCKRYHHPYAVALMDINRFKQINDTYGHEKGDEMLITFAQAVKSRIRTIDTFGRWGGDEFLLICPNTDYNGIETLISQIKDAIYQEMAKVVPNTFFCYGSAEFLLTDQSYQEIVSRADQKMYQCKNNS